MSFMATKFLTDIPQVFYKVIVLNQNKEIYPYPYRISVYFKNVLTSDRALLNSCIKGQFASASNQDMRRVCKL